MTKKEKLAELLTKLNSLNSEDDFNSFMKDEVEHFSTKLSDSPTVKMLQKFNEDLKSIRDDLETFAPKDSVDKSTKELQEELQEGLSSLSGDFEVKLQEVSDSIPTIPEKDPPFDPSPLEEKIESVHSDLNTQLATKINYDDKGLKKEIASVKKQLKTYIENDAEEDRQAEEELNKRLKKLQQDITNRINALGGGSMNRKVSINGTDALTRYTDINLKAGPNTTITYTNNDQTKNTDITITASGGGGGGIARSIQSVSINTLAGSASATDYVYLCTGTMNLTLPDATAGNTNLYTIKNVGTGVVTVNTTSGQTIDGSLTAVLPLQYTSIDVESDTANWNIT